MLEIKVKQEITVSPFYDCAMTYLSFIKQYNSRLNEALRVRVSFIDTSNWWPVEWLNVLANIEPSEVRRIKAFLRPSYQSISTWLIYQNGGYCQETHLGQHSIISSNRIHSIISSNRIDQTMNGKIFGTEWMYEIANGLAIRHWGKLVSIFRDKHGSTKSYTHWTRKLCSFTTPMEHGWLN